MPAVCKFYLKGYCRYGSSCRFEHPGENDYNNYNQSNYGTSTNFSFKTALNETLPSSSHTNTYTNSSNSNFSNYQSNNRTTGFSFARALETTAGPQFSSIGHHDVDMSEGLSSNRQQLNSIFSQTYNNLTQQQPSSIFAPTPVQQQQQQLHNYSQYQQPPFNSLGGAPQLFGQSSSSLPLNSTNFSSHKGADLISAQKSYYTDINDLTEAEVKAFQAAKFELHLIPIRPPPKILCS